MWAFQIGMRGEKTQAKGISVVADKVQPFNYYKLFPTLFVSYAANKKNTFTFNFSRRINRPDYSLLNPFRWYLNPYAYVEGNPFLQPSYNHNAEFSHSYDKKLTTTLSYILQTDGFNQITLVENNSFFQVIKPLNCFTYQACQLTSALSFSPAKWLETNLQSKLFFSLSQSTIPQTAWDKIKAWTANVFADNQIIFNKAKTILGSFTIWYQSPSVIGSLKTQSIWNMDAGVKALLLKKRLQLSLTGSDVFRSTVTRFYSNVNNILQYYHNYYDVRRVKFMIVFNFGSNKFSRKERLTGNEEEKNRVK